MGRDLASATNEQPREASIRVNDIYGDFFTSDPNIMHSHRPVHLIESVVRVN